MPSARIGSCQDKSDHPHAYVLRLGDWHLKHNILASLRNPWTYSAWLHCYPPVCDTASAAVACNSATIAIMSETALPPWPPFAAT